MFCPAVLNLRSSIHLARQTVKFESRFHPSSTAREFHEFIDLHPTLQRCIMVGAGKVNIAFDF